MHAFASCYRPPFQKCRLVKRVPAAGAATGTRIAANVVVLLIQWENWKGEGEQTKEIKGADWCFVFGNHSLNNRWYFQGPLGQRSVCCAWLLQPLANPQETKFRIMPLGWGYLQLSTQDSRSPHLVAAAKAYPVPSAS